MAFSAPVLKHRFFDENGDPLVGGKLYSYRAGTTTPRATYTDASAVTENTNPIILDANGECDIFFTTGNFKFVLTDADDVEYWTVDNITLPSSGGGGGGLPDGGDEFAVLQKISSDNQDADWVLPTVSGFSARYNQEVDLTGYQAMVDFIFNITYTAPTISLAVTGSGTVREKGTAVTSATMTATIVKRSDPIQEVRFYENTSTLVDTQISGGAIPAGGVSTYAWTGSFSDNYTFRAQVDDNGATGGPTTVSSNVNFTFVYPYYFGVGAVGLSAAGVAALTKDVRVSTASLGKSFSPNGSQVYYFAYLASYGALTSILDENGFEVISDWTLRTENITGLDASAQSYRIYEFNNLPVAGTYSFTFIR